MSAASGAVAHCIEDYTGGPEGVAPIEAHCRCGIKSAPKPTCDEADADLELHVPAPAYASDVRFVRTFQAYCSCGWESDPEETEEGADALADDHDDTHVSAPSEASADRMSAASGGYETVAPSQNGRRMWSWRCCIEGCGWVGVALATEEHAEREAARRAAEPHCLACGHPAPRRGSWRHECQPSPSDAPAVSA